MKNKESKYQMFNREGKNFNKNNDTFGIGEFDKDLAKRQSKNAKRRKVQGTNSKWKRTRRSIKHKLIAR